MPSDLKRKVADYIGISVEDLEEIQGYAPYSYKEYHIERKNGEKRLIAQPTNEVKAVQHAMINIVFSNVPIHSCATAYQKGEGSPIRDNVERHSSFNYSLRIDFKDFFATIMPADLIDSMKTSESLQTYDDDDYKFMSDVCFRKKKHRQLGLAVGAPSSPIISNIIMYRIDTSIHSYIRTNSQDAAYSRYADDIVYSTNTRGDCEKFYKWFSRYLKSLDKPKLKINSTKTAYMSRGTRRRITGLFVTPEGKVTIGREKKRYIRKLIYDYTQKNLSDDKIKYLSGYLAFVLDAEPFCYDRLVIKYGAELLTQILSHHA